MDSSTVFFQRYELSKRLGHNASAEVWQALDKSNHRRVVVSVASGKDALSTDDLERFQREASHLARLTHPHIVTIVDFGIDEGRPFIVSDWVEGPDLTGALRRFPSPQRRTPEETQTLAEMALAICDAAGLAHRAGLIHGGIRPSRIRVTPAGEVKVTGFDAGRLRRSLPLKDTDLVDWIYASPEQAGGQPLTAASDVYSLGALLFEIFTGRPPFAGHDAASLARKHLTESPPAPGRLNPNLPAGLEEIILRAMAKDPADRFRNGEQMARVLRVYCVEDTAAGDVQVEAGIDWQIVGLVFVLIIAWGGLIPLWIYVYFLYNPPGA